MRATDDLARLRRLLGGPDAAWLVDRVRGRIAQGQVGPLAGSVQLREPTADQRAAARRLVGSPSRASTALRVDLGELEDLLRRGAWSAGLADAVTVLTGPVVNRPRERAVTGAAWTAAAEAFAPAIRAHPTLATWWSQWCAAGHLKRAARSDPVAARRLAADAASCLGALPSAGEPLAVFARRITGDAHALDRARPLGRLVLAAVGALASLGRLGGFDNVLAPDDALGPREVWARSGLLVSAVSSTVLCLGVPGGDPTETGQDGVARATASALTTWRAAGVPVVLTLDQVRSGGVGALAPRDVVHVCENPSVVEVVASEAAQRAQAGATTPLPAAGRPVLICTYGQPGAAVLELLNRLTAAGARVRYHGDFDWAGLRIAATLATHIPWEPWRFGVADYLAAVSRAAGREHLALRGAPAAAPWDPSLADAMAARGAAIEEEEVVALLVRDLLT